MELLIFDMDGVLLKPRGYHMALQETVRLAGQAAGWGDVHLTDAQIAKFESLGISSEWHSSAFCMAVLDMQAQAGLVRENHRGELLELELEALFEAIAVQPMENPAGERGLTAVEIMAKKLGVSAANGRKFVEQSVSIDHSPTMNWFQELVLGSEVYAETYQKPSQLGQDSYLKQFDRKILSDENGKKLLSWATRVNHGAAVMTNRPSSGPPGFEGAPDAELGTELVGLGGIPLIGYGEILWLAEKTGLASDTINKPNWAHALAAILYASGLRVTESLEQVVSLFGNGTGSGSMEFFSHLKNSTITVFEDTPAGLVSVQNASDLINNAGVEVSVRKIGVSEDRAKRTALEAQGAEVFPDVNAALDSLDSFRVFSGN